MHVATETDTAMSGQCATALLERNRKVKMMNVCQRKSTENRIAVVALAKRHIALVRSVREAESVTDQVNLHVVARSRHTIVDLLQKGDIRLAMTSEP